MFGRAAGVIAALGVLASVQPASAAGELLKVRMGGDSTQTRVVIDLDRSVTAKLVADGGGDRRLTLVLPGVDPPAGLQGTGRGLVGAWTVEPSGGGARLRMDLSADAQVTKRFLLPPADGVAHYRYVIDVTRKSGLQPVTTQAPAKVQKAELRTRFLPATRPRQLEKAALSLRKVVVIDAGHGGRDTGAQGQEGHEKDITLAAARALKSRLESSGRYKVVLTRETDAYVGLETRVRIAQRASADLFISLHADSVPEAHLRGASVYTLSDKASGRAARFVSKDDWFMQASQGGERGVSDILFDLTQRATRNRSAQFAQTLIGRLEGKTPMLRKSHRDAGFMVLLAPDVPAVLLEMGFVSNLQDEQLLRDPIRRARITDAVAQAIDDHFAQPQKTPGLRLAAR